jgi:photosystem II stability/assembly factor-like uncharacterized protein
MTRISLLVLLAACEGTMSSPGGDSGTSARDGGGRADSSTPPGEDAGRSDAGPPPDAEPLPACLAGTPMPPRAPGAPALEVGVWTYLNPPEVTFGSDPAVFTQGLALDPCNPNVIYVGVCAFDPEPQRAGLYKSEDAGATWRRVGELDEPVRVRVDPRDPNHLYVGDGVRGATMGFWRSFDGGETWEMPESFRALDEMAFVFDVYDVAPDPNDFDHVLVSSHSPWDWSGSHPLYSRAGGVLETRDGGDTWVMHDPEPSWGYGHSIWFLRSGAWLIGTQGDGFWRSTDEGESWLQVTTNNLQHGGGGIFYASTGALFAGGTPSLMKSMDDGVTWTLHGPHSGFNAIIGDGTTLYTGPVFGPRFITSPETDGETWTEQAGQEYGSGPFEMAFDETNGIVYAATWNEGLLALRVR